MSSSPWRTTYSGHWSDLNRQALVALQSTKPTHDEWLLCTLSVLPRPLSSKGLLIDSVIVSEKSATVPSTPLSKRLCEHLCHLSAGIRTPLVGSLWVCVCVRARMYVCACICVRGGPATGDSFGSLCIV